MTRLDDLLGYDDDTKPNRSRRPWVRVTIASAFVLVASVLIYGLPRRLIGIGMPFVMVLAVVAALVTLQQILTILDIRRLPSTLRDNPRFDQPTLYANDGIREAARSWNNRLDYAHDDPRHFTRMIQPAFIELIDERIRLAHGVTRENDPERYRELVDPRLWKFMIEPVPRRVTPHEIATLVALMEAL